MNLASPRPSCPSKGTNLCLTIAKSGIWHSGTVRTTEEKIVALAAGPHGIIPNPGAEDSGIRPRDRGPALEHGSEKYSVVTQRQDELGLGARMHEESPSWEGGMWCQESEGGKS